MATAAQRVTGISPHQLASAPPFRDVWQALIRHLDIPPGDVALVGHNSRTYDDVLLVAELNRVGLDPHSPFGPQVVGQPECFDTLQAARLAGGKQRLNTADVKLSTLYRAVTGTTLEGAHEALADCRAVVALLAWTKLQDWFQMEPWMNRVQAFLQRRAKRSSPAAAAPPPAVAPGRPPVICKGTQGAERARPALIVSQGECLRCGVVFSIYFSHTCSPAIPRSPRY